ncbi:VOC family protein [Thermomicrobiaceae bacterium CFH 74404]|uniref:VOC family protein n=1 Tax=Thermalbibacter longus TaxID=2951981 RepID=A0AA42BB28_9BACT|nr:VOC family protein [Thermalbibacter longus]MCM8750511.1 VOC family protein [Thermalbibacter longus]
MRPWLHHVEVRVPDLQAALAFHQDVLQLTLVEQQDDTAYLACGHDPSIDLCLSSGGTGLGHVAYAVPDAETLAAYAERLSQNGVPYIHVTDAEPGIAAAVRFSLPSGHGVEFVVPTPISAASYSYAHPAVRCFPESRSSLLLDLDHVTLRHTDVQAVASFLRDVLGFHLPDVRLTGDGRWRGAWLHLTDQHHDLAVLLGNDGETLDHIAFRVAGIEAMKAFADMLAAQGGKVEVGPGRHSIGGNLFMYFWTPDGNRYELSAEMALVANRAAPTTFWGDSPDLFSPWGIRPPESFRKGS